MRNSRGMFCWLEELVVEKQRLFVILEKNNMFGEIEEVVGVSKIPLSMEREKNISSCFMDEHIDFKYPNDVEDFDDL